ncbi:ephrin type-A receptor 2-like isoform X2 [Symsagittifera roscoffensis]|uniref:ephrin type-A receptor 2-like isoform X2 n=1 Tax=Symsagittifera roscoffensis TaxID=84072 RepID=UPI00307C75C0
MAPIKRTNRANSTAEQDVCNKCSETIGGWIFCYSCRKWMHDKCCGISPELVQQITMIDNIQYVCVELLGKTDLTQWSPEHVTGRSRNGFFYNQSRPLVCDVGDDLRNFLLSPTINLLQATTLWISLRYKITPCEDLRAQYGRKCTEHLDIHLIPVEKGIWGDDESKAAVKEDGTTGSSAASFNYHQLEDTKTKIGSVVTRGDTVTKFESQVDLSRFSFLSEHSEFARVVVEDSGSCAEIHDFSASYRRCPQVVRAQALFNETAAPFVPKHPVTGTCVRGAEGKYAPTFSCKSDGEWDEKEQVLDLCQCNKGFQPSGHSCQTCTPGNFKEERGNKPCVSCPLNSYTRQFGSQFCPCKANYYRAPDEPHSLACGRAPGVPRNVSAVVRGTRVTLTWQRPEDDGGRFDIWYSVQCATCKQNPGQSSKLITPSYNKGEVRGLSVNVTNLHPHTDYMFHVSAHNSLSPHVSSSVSFAQVTFKTAENPQIEITHSGIVGGGGVVLKWQPPTLQPDDPSSSNSPEYRVLRVHRGQPNYVYTTDTKFMFKGLEKGLHEFRVSFSDGSHPSRTVQLESQGGPSTRREEEYKRLVFTVGVVLTVILILVVACLAAVCCYRKTTHTHHHSQYMYQQQQYPYMTKDKDLDLLNATLKMGNPNDFSVSPFSTNNFYSKMSMSGTGSGDIQQQSEPVGGCFVDPTQADPGCAEQLLAECGVRQLREEALTIPTQSDYSACELNGSFGFLKGSLLQRGADAETVQVQVLIKRGSYSYLQGTLHAQRGDLERGEKVKGGMCAEELYVDRRTLLNEVSIAAQLSYDCNVLKLYGIVRNDFPEVAVYEHVETTLEWALRNNTLWQQQKNSRFNAGSAGTLSRSSLAEQQQQMSTLTSARCSPEVHVMRGVAAGMQYLAELGYTHKVLRSRNVYLTEEGSPKIAGFDHRALLDEELLDATIETKELWLEMLPWFGPEVLDCGKFSPCSDVWSFGVLMWEVVSRGDRPWADLYPEQIQRAVLCGQPLPVTHTPCPLALYSLMLQCWQPQPHQRPSFAFLSQSLCHLVKQRDSLAQQVNTAATISSANYFPLPPTNGSNEPLGWGWGWTVDQCLAQLQLSQYSGCFRQHGLHLLAQLLQARVDHTGLKKIGLHSGRHRRRLIKYLASVSQQQQQHQQNQQQHDIESDTGSGQNTVKVAMRLNPAVSVL